MSSLLQPFRFIWASKPLGKKNIKNICSRIDRQTVRQTYKQIDRYIGTPFGALKQTQTPMFFRYVDFSTKKWFPTIQQTNKQTNKQRSILTAENHVDKNARTRLGSALRLIRVESTTGSFEPMERPVVRFTCHTLQGINISHLGKRNIIFKSDFWWDMLVPWRVIPIAKLQKFTPYVVETTMSVLFFWSLTVCKRWEAQ